jgi:hypothetical protein
METNLNNNRTPCHEPVVQLLLSLCLTAYGSCALGHHPHDVIDALALSPSYSEDKTLYIANSNHLLKSRNGGYRWKELSNGLDNSAPVSSIAFAPSRDKSPTLFISTLGNGIYSSTNDGASWQNLSANLKNLEIRELSARSDSHVLAIDVTGGLHVTHDSGQTWKTAVLPEGVVITAVSPPVRFTEPGILAGDSHGRILLSTDNGISWKIAGKSKTSSPEKRKSQQLPSTLRIRLDPLIISGRRTTACIRHQTRVSPLKHWATA